MKTRSWLVTACAVAVVAAIVFGKPGVSQGAGAGVGSIVGETYSFSGAISAAGSIGGIDGGSVEANVVNDRSAAGGFGDAFCRVVISFSDEKGNVLHKSALTLGPGEIGRVELPRREVSTDQEVPAELVFRTTFEVLDRYRDGRVRPCSAIPSVRVFDQRAGRTEYYLPIETR